MNKYDYRAEMYNDIRDFITNDFVIDEYADDSGKWLREDNREEVQEALYDALWTCDTVTGNGSGSYTCSAWQAEENLCHNLDLLREACDEFGCKMGDAVERGVEYCDVTIRCYLLGEVLGKVLNHMQEDY